MMKAMTFFLLSFCWLVSNATIWRVNSNQQINADFSSLQNAINSALVLNGDTLYLENGSYFGTTTLTKNLVIIGPGYFLAENDSTYANPFSALISSLSLGNGSKGSKITGVTVTGDVLLSHNNASNITIERSYVGGQIVGSAADTGLTIRQCYLVGGINSGNLVSSNVYNNIITNTITCYAANGSHTIYNNVFYYYSTSPVWILYVKNSSVFNNIIIREPAGSSEYCVRFPDCTNSSFARNLMTQSVYPVFPDNIYGEVKENIFTCVISTEKKWELKAGSPAIGYGTNGDDCGIYSGPMHYVLSGLPWLLPRIFKANIPSSGNGNVIPVHITAKTQEE